MLSHGLCYACFSMIVNEEDSHDFYNINGTYRRKRLIVVILYLVLEAWKQLARRTLILSSFWILGTVWKRKYLIFYYSDLLLVPKLFDIFMWILVIIYLFTYLQQSKSFINLSANHVILCRHLLSVSVSQYITCRNNAGILFFL